MPAGRPLLADRGQQCCTAWWKDAKQAQRWRSSSARARSHCRAVLPLIHFTPDSLRDSVPLFLKRRCNRALRSASRTTSAGGPSRRTRRCASTPRSSMSARTGPRQRRQLRGGPRHHSALPFSLPIGIFQINESGARENDGVAPSYRRPGSRRACSRPRGAGTRRRSARCSPKCEGHQAGPDVGPTYSLSNLYSRRNA
jgi:hypothetical protein